MGQFALPLALIGGGVLGLWLLGPKKSSTSKPDSMPKLNSGLRGETMPITFGTNKVSAHMVWSKNWTAERAGGGGKGKGGGSGGFGSGKGGSGGTGYNYKWDLIYHYGMFDVPSSLIRGWVGTDEIDPLIMAGLSSGYSTGILSSIINRSQDGQAATLSYLDAFIGHAYPTGDASLSSWPYFSSQEAGLTCAWPYTGWVGFNQLLLGQTPAVPQIFFEWGPLETGFSFDDGHYLSTTRGQGGGHEFQAPFAQDDNGNTYFLAGRAGGGIAIYDQHTGTLMSELSDADITAEFVAVGLTGARGTSMAFGIDGDPTYFYTFAGGVTPYYVGCWHMETDGTATFINGVEYTESFGIGGGVIDSIYAVGDMGATNEVLIVGQNGFVHDFHLMVLHAPAFFRSLPPTLGFSTTANGRHLVVSEMNNPFPVDGNSKNVMQAGVLHNGKVMYYFGPKAMDYAAANPTDNTYLASIQPTYPDGCMVQVNVNSDGAGSCSYTFIGPNNGMFLDESGAEVCPYTDADHVSNYNDYTAPQVYTVDGNKIALIIRMYDTDLYKVRVRAFIFNALTGFYTELGGVTGHVGDSGDYTASPSNPVARYQNNELIVTAHDGSSNNVTHGTFGASLPSGMDVTPAYVIYRILTHPAFGMATSAIFGFTVTEDRINQPSYLAAVAECENQGCYISVTYDQTNNVLDIINDLLALYGGFMTENDGIISFGIVKDSDTPVRTLDNSHFVVSPGKPPVKTIKAALEDGYNKVSFTYLDREIEYNQNQVIQEDPVDQDINGPRPKDWNTRYVMAGSLATQIAVRALWSNLYGRDQYEFTTGWKDWDLRPGALVTLVDSFDPTLSAGVRARLLRRKATDTAGSYKWEAVRDYQHINTASGFFTSVLSIDPGMGSILEPAQAPMWQTAYEVSREFQGAQPEVYFGYGQQSITMGAQLHVSVDGATYIQAQDIQPYIISGIIASSLQDRPKGYVEEGVEFYLFPTSGFNASTPTFVQTYALDDLAAATRRAGATVLIVGSEAMAAEDATLLAQNHYRAKRLFRGWGGTPISGQSSGAHFHAHGAGIFNREITQDDVGLTLSYKIVPYNFAGKTYDISSVDASTYTIRGNFWKARAQPVTKLWVNSGVTQPQSMALRGPFVGVNSGGCDLIATWPLHDNNEGLGAGGFGANSFGHFIMSDSVGWRIDIYSGNGTAASSFVVNTPYFKYTVAQNSADFNGFGRDLILRVTPFTVKGEGPVTDVRSISMNW